MAKFHVTKAGRVEPCGATVRACPLGEVNHYENGEEAAKAAVAKGFVEVEELTPEQQKLVKLSESANWAERREVAKNPSTPMESLDRLAGDENKYVRREVAKNPRTPADVLGILAEDEDVVVRSGAAWNANLPNNLLEELTNSKERPVLYGVAMNPNTPVEIKVEILKNFIHLEIEETGEPLFYSVLRDHPGDLPTETFVQVAKHKTKDVRLFLAKYPTVPIKALEVLATDDNEEVRNAVLKRAKELGDPYLAGLVEGRNASTN